MLGDDSCGEVGLLAGVKGCLGCRSPCEGDAADPTGPSQSGPAGALQWGRAVSARRDVSHFVVASLVGVLLLLRCEVVHDTGCRHPVIRRPMTESGEFAFGIGLPQARRSPSDVVDAGTVSVTAVETVTVISVRLACVLPRIA